MAKPALFLFQILLGAQLMFFSGAGKTGPVTFQNEFSPLTIHCETVLTAKWGSAPGEFGFSRNLSSQIFEGPYAPVFDDAGRMYIADPINHRINRYQNDTFDQTIPVPESFTLPYGFEGQFLYWSQIAVSDNQIFLKYSVYRNNRILDRIGVLDLQGKLIKNIDLEPYYPLRSIYATPIVSDREGGIYLLLDPMGFIYYDSSYHPKLTPVGNDWEYANMLVGWDKSLYTYSPMEEEIHLWEKVGNSSHLVDLAVKESISVINLGKYVALLGTDRDGQIYLFSDNESGDTLYRVSESGKRIEGGKLSQDLSRRFISLSPTGDLVGLVYDEQDPSISLSIIRCETITVPLTNDQLNNVTGGV